MTDSEFCSLMYMEKQFVRPQRVILPGERESKVFDVKSISTRDIFMLDYSRHGRYDLKHKSQLRHSKDILMVRLEINGPEHINPDGHIISRNHIHIYKEGYDGLAWAYELDDILPQVLPHATPLNIFKVFCEYCKIDVSNVFLQEVL